MPENTPGERALFRLRMEKRRGKTVTVAAAEGLGEEELGRLLGELKRRLATGGTCRESSLQLQGEQRQRLREELSARGYRVKG